MLARLPRASMGQVVLLTPPKSSHPIQLLSCQHFVRVSPLTATLMDLPASVANKRLTAELTPLDATLTKNRGWGSAPCASEKDARPESANGGGADSRFRPCRKGFFSGLTLLSLFAPRVFHNSFAINRFLTLSQNCRVSPNNSHSGTLSTEPLQRTTSLRTASAHSASLRYPFPLFASLSSPALHWSAASPPNFMTTQLPSLVILGRPNVGKSTLFNRLTGTRRSIVTNEPGITRDRIYGKAEWRGRALEIVDTGGIVPDD